MPNTVVASIEPLSVFGPKFIRLAPRRTEDTGRVPRARATRSPRRSPRSSSPTSWRRPPSSSTHVDPHDVRHDPPARSPTASAASGDEIGRTIDSSAELLEVGAAHADDTRRVPRRPRRAGDHPGRPRRRRPCRSPTTSPPCSPCSPRTPAASTSCSTPPRPSPTPSPTSSRTTARSSTPPSGPSPPSSTASRPGPTRSRSSSHLIDSFFGRLSRRHPLRRPRRPGRWPACAASSPSTRASSSGSCRAPMMLRKTRPSCGRRSSPSTVGLTLWIARDHRRASISGDRYELVARFDDVAGLHGGDAVKLAGVGVGRVKGIDVDHGRGRRALRGRRRRAPCRSTPPWRSGGAT